MLLEKLLATNVARKVTSNIEQHVSQCYCHNVAATNVA